MVRRTTRSSDGRGIHPWIFLAVALLARLAWAWLVPIEPVSDSGMYEAFARSIASGRGYAYPDGRLTAYWPVGAPAIYAAVYALGGGTALIAWLQALVGVAVIGLTWRLADRFLGREVAGVAGWLLAVWPLMIAFTTILASELLFVACLLAALNVWASERLPLVLRAALWGAAVTAATYIRPTAYPLLLLFPLIAFLLERDLRKAVTTLTVSVVVAAILFAPWVIRNDRLLGGFVLVAANSGLNLWMGNNPGSDGGFMPLPPGPLGNELERDRRLGGEAVRYITSHPLAYLRLSVRRTVMTYDRESIGVVWNEPALTSRFGAEIVMPLKLASAAFWWAMLALGTAGVVVVVRRRQARRSWPLLTTLAFCSLVPILTVGGDRYHVPINPLLAIFAASAVVALKQRWRVGTVHASKNRSPLS